MENDRFLRPPPTQTISVCVDGEEHKANLVHAYRSLRAVLTALDGADPIIDTEEKLLERLVIKNHNHFRHEKSFKDVKVVLKCARRLREVQIRGVLANLHSCLPLVVDVVQQHGPVLLPTLQMLHFAMLRLMGAFAVIRKLDVFCKQAALAQEQRMKTGHFWNAALQFLAAVSRIWSVSQAMARQIESAYCSLCPLLPLLPSAAVPFLSDPSRTFPPSLVKSMSVEASNADVAALKEDAQAVLEKALTSNAELGEVIKRDDVTPSAMNKSKPSKQDCGRASLQQSLIALTKRQKLICATVAKWAGPADVVAFVEAENELRKKDRKKAVTKPLDQSDWKALRTRLNEACSDSKAGKNLPKMKQMLAAFVLHPQSKGRSVPEIDLSFIKSVL